MVENLGIELISSEPGKVHARMPVDERTCQPFGMLSGGASLALAEMAAGYGSLQLCNSDQTACGVQVSANHVSMAPVGINVDAFAEIVHQGRTTHVWNVDIKTPEGKLVSTARITNRIIDKR